MLLTFQEHNLVVILPLHDTSRLLSFCYSFLLGLCFLSAILVTDVFMCISGDADFFDVPSFKTRLLPINMWRLIRKLDKELFYWFSSAHYQGPSTFFPGIATLFNFLSTSYTRTRPGTNDSQLCCGQGRTHAPHVFSLSPPSHSESSDLSLSHRS